MEEKNEKIKEKREREATNIIKEVIEKD